MPRYFFDCRVDGQHIHDDEGVELTSVEAAEKVAAIALAELVMEILPSNHEGSLAVDVRNDNGRVLLATELTFKTSKKKEPALLS